VSAFPISGKDPASAALAISVAAAIAISAAAMPATS
jgi:hypothetical protein